MERTRGENNFDMGLSYLSEASESRLALPLDCAARTLPIASVIDVSVIVGPNRNILFSNGRAK